jgi:hypothetical protein
VKVTEKYFPRHFTQTGSITVKENSSEMISTLHVSRDTHGRFKALLDLGDLGIPIFLLFFKEKNFTI